MCTVLDGRFSSDNANGLIIFQISRIVKMAAMKVKRFVDLRCFIAKTADS